MKEKKIFTNFSLSHNLKSSKNTKMSDLPKDYDVIIVGTGLTESILAAALARIGKIVLHIDRNQFYGGEFTSFTLSNLIEWADNFKIGNYGLSSTDCNNDLNKYFYDIEYNWNTKFDEKY